MQKYVAWAQKLAPVARVVYQNRKAELALIAAAAAIVREIVQAASGH